MKNKAYFLSVIFVLALPILVINSIHAQINGDQPWQKAAVAVQQSSHIFEGIVTKQEFFKDVNGSIWTANLVTMTRIFKGMENLSCQTVVIVNRGSAGQSVDFGNGPEYQEVGSHSISYVMEQRGIFFCKELAHYPTAPNNPSDNPIMLQTVNEEFSTFLSYKYDPRILDTVSLGTVNNFALGFFGLSFDNFNEVQDWLKNGYGIDTSEFVKCRSIPTMESTNDEQVPILINPRMEVDDRKHVPKRSMEPNPDENESDPEKQEIESDKLKAKRNAEAKKKILEYEQALSSRIKNSLVPNVSRAGEELTFTLENEQITGSNPKYFEFDVMVECNQNGTFLDNTPIHLSYNTGAFGSNIAANNKISVTKGGAFNDPTYLDPNTLSNDWASDTVVVLLGIDFQATMNRTQVPTSPTELLHVKIEIAGCLQWTDMFFVNEAIASNVNYFTANANDPWTAPIMLYDAYHYTGDLNLELCLPVIDNFTTSVGGGVNTYLFISGQHFGSAQGAGEVWIKDAQLAGANYITKQDPADYVQWTDDLIQLRVPTQVWAAQVQLGYLPVTGSGEIAVETNQGHVAYSNSPVEVKYTVNTTQPQIFAFGAKFRYNLVNTNGQGSYTFHCDTSISNYPYRKAVVAQAIHDWNCRTEVNWELGSDTTLQQWVQNDGVNLIYIDPNLHGSPIAETARGAGVTCPVNGNPNGVEVLFGEVDIRLSIDFSGTANPNAYWWYDTSGLSVPTNAYDFYAVLLHELGHAHQLNHVNDIDDPMYIVTNYGPIAANDRHYNPWKWGNTIEGGENVVMYSGSITWNCGTTTHIPAVPPDCTIPTYVSEVESDLGITVYPNPTAGNLQVTGISEPTEYAILDATGKLIISGTVEPNQSIDMSRVSNGLYFIQLRSIDQAESELIIKH